MGRPLVADTGGLLRALARKTSGEPAWPDFERALRDASRIVVPSLVLAEVDYFLRDLRPAMRTLCTELLDPDTTYELIPTEGADLARAVALDEKFADLGLGLVDGMVAAVAERMRVYRVLTIDHDDFGPLRIGERYHLRLQIVP